MKESDSEFVRKAIGEIVEAQLRDDAPAEVQLTAARLAASGYSRPEALALIGCALSREMFEILGSSECFDERRYIASLKRLPALPWE